LKYLEQPALNECYAHLHKDVKNYFTFYELPSPQASK